MSERTSDQSFTHSWFAIVVQLLTGITLLVMSVYLWLLKDVCK